MWRRAGRGGKTAAWPIRSMWQQQRIEWPPLLPVFRSLMTFGTVPSRCRNSNRPSTDWWWWSPTGFKVSTFPKFFFFSYDFKHFIMRFVENRIDKFLSMVIKYSSSIHHHTPALTAKKYFSLTRDVSIVYFLWHLINIMMLVTDRGGWINNTGTTLRHDRACSLALLIPQCSAPS